MSRTPRAAKPAKAAHTTTTAEAEATPTKADHCTCTSRAHPYGVPGCKYGRGGDGVPVPTDPKTGEMVPESAGELRARNERIEAAKRGEEDEE